jgi:hypothetical protein
VADAKTEEQKEADATKRLVEKQATADAEERQKNGYVARAANEKIGGESFDYGQPA